MIYALAKFEVATSNGLGDAIIRKCSIDTQNYNEIFVTISARPVISAPQRVTSAALGDQVSLVCDASGYPSPDITWHRKDASMPE